MLSASITRGIYGGKTKTERAETLKGGKKCITITDDEIIDTIKDIMTLPEYCKSFNKVVNHSLKYGVAKLYETLFIKGGRADEIETKLLKEHIKSPEEQRTEDYMEELSRLMTEDITYLAMIKSIVSSLFNAECARLGNEKIAKEKYEDGLYRRTPKYLEAYESRTLKNIRGDK